VSQLLRRLDSTRAMHSFVLPLQRSVYAPRESVPFEQNDTSAGLSKWRKEYAERQTQLTSRAKANRHIASVGRECSITSRHDPRASGLGQGNVTFTELYHYMKSKYPCISQRRKTSILQETPCSTVVPSKIRLLGNKIRILTSIESVASDAKFPFDQKSRFSESARQVCSRKMLYRYESVDDLVLL
jgi:hypothetical protein